MLYQISRTYNINPRSKNTTQHRLNFIHVHLWEHTLKITCEIKLQVWSEALSCALSVLVLKSNLGFSFYSLKITEYKCSEMPGYYRTSQHFKCFVMQFPLSPLGLLPRTFLLNPRYKSSLLNTHEHRIPQCRQKPAQLWMGEIQPLEKTETFTGAFTFLQSITTKYHETK